MKIMNTVNKFDYIWNFLYPFSVRYNLIILIKFYQMYYDLRAFKTHIFYIEWKLETQMLAITRKEKIVLQKSYIYTQ